MVGDRRFFLQDIHVEMHCCVTIPERDRLIFPAFPILAPNSYGSTMNHDAQLHSPGKDLRDLSINSNIMVFV
jgi:hypothetical protein